MTRQSVVYPTTYRVWYQWPVPEQLQQLQLPLVFPKNDMKILFVSTVPVFPPSDGVRIPPAHYIKGLAGQHEVDFLLLDYGDRSGSWEADCQATAEVVAEFSVVPIRRSHKLAGILGELFVRGPYYGSWNLTECLPPSVLTRKYDAVIGCTSIAIAIMTQPAIRQALANQPRWIAAMSDLYSLVMAKLASTASKAQRITARLNYFVSFGLRSRIVAINEMRMLDHYDKVFVQTEKELDWIAAKGGDRLARKSVCLTNAAADELFSLPLERKGKSLFFVGSLSGLYGERFHWFVQNVWRHVRATHADLSLTAIGKGASDLLAEEMKINDIRYIPFVDNLQDIYTENHILVAPIFKGYGLINKVVEAMAAGCVVVGDETAFNGIQGFIAGVHGLVANDEQEFIHVLANELDDDGKLNTIRQAAHDLMQKHFRWSQRIEAIEESLRSNE